MNVQNKLIQIIKKSGFEEDFIAEHEYLWKDSGNKLSVEEIVYILVPSELELKQSLFSSNTNDDSGLYVYVSDGASEILKKICEIIDLRYADLGEVEQQVMIGLVELALLRESNESDIEAVRDAIRVIEYFDEEFFTYKQKYNVSFSSMKNVYCSECSWKNNRVIEILMLALCFIRGNSSTLYQKFLGLYEEIRVDSGINDEEYEPDKELVEVVISMDPIKSLFEHHSH